MAHGLDGIDDFAASHADHHVTALGASDFCQPCDLFIAAFAREAFHCDLKSFGPGRLVIWNNRPLRRAAGNDQCVASQSLNLFSQAFQCACLLDVSAGEYCCLFHCHHPIT